MATFFSGQTIGYWSSASNYMYGTLTGTVTRSGNTVTLSGMSLAITSRYSATGTSSFTMTVAGTGTAKTIQHPPTTMTLNNASISVTPEQTSANVSWSTSDGYSGTFNITFPSGYTAPNTPTVSIEEVGANYIKVKYGTTSFGNPSTGTVFLYGGVQPTPVSQVALKITTGDSVVTIGDLMPNTTYYFRARANNTKLDSQYSSIVNATTKAGFYGSVNGTTKVVNKLYGSVNGNTKQITKLYGSVNGSTKRIW